MSKSSSIFGLLVVSTIPLKSVEGAACQLSEWSYFLNEDFGIKISENLALSNEDGDPLYPFFIQAFTVDNDSFSALGFECRNCIPIKASLECYYKPDLTPGPCNRFHPDNVFNGPNCRICLNAVNFDGCFDLTDIPPTCNVEGKAFQWDTPTVPATSLTLGGRKDFTRSIASCIAVGGIGISDCLRAFAKKFSAEVSAPNPGCGVCLLHALEESFDTPSSLSCSTDLNTCARDTLASCGVTWPKCDLNTEFTPFSFRTDYNVENLTDVWTQLAACHVANEGDADAQGACKTELIAAVESIRTIACKTCIEDFVYEKGGEGGDIESLFVDCADETKVEDCNAKAVSLKDALVTYCDLKDAPPTCGDADFSPFSFKNDEWYVGSINDVWLQLAYCRANATSNNEDASQCDDDIWAAVESTFGLQCRSCVDLFVSSNVDTLIALFDDCSDEEKTTECNKGAFDLSAGLVAACSILAKCQDVQFTPFTFQEDKYSIDNLRGVWTQLALCHADAGEDDTAKAQCITDIVDGVIANSFADCGTCVNSFIAKSDLGDFFANCADPEKQDDCNSFADSLMSSLMETCAIQDYTPPPPTCDGETFTGITFDANDLSYTGVDILSTWLALAQCIVDAANDADKMQACNDNAISAWEAATTPSCATCGTDFMNTESAQACLRDVCAGEEGPSSENCHTCAIEQLAAFEEACDIVNNTTTASGSMSLTTVLSVTLVLMAIVGM